MSYNHSKYFQDATARLKSAIKITDVLSFLGIPLRADGFIVCPVHAEKTGSCKIYTKTNRFKCFGCGASGDIIDLVAVVNHCDNRTAMNMLAEYFHVQIQSEKLTAAQIREINRQKHERERVQTEQDAFNRKIELWLGKLADYYFTVNNSLQIIERANKTVFESYGVPDPEYTEYCYKLSEKLKLIDFLYHVLNGWYVFDNEFSELHGTDKKHIIDLLESGAIKTLTFNNY